MIKAFVIIFALLLGGCEVVLIPKRPSHVYFTTERAAYEKVTVIHNDCDAGAYKPYAFPPVECTDFYDMYSGRYEGMCCEWSPHIVYYEEWCDWLDNCVGWTYAGSKSY